MYYSASHLCEFFHAISSAWIILPMKSCSLSKNRSNSSFSVSSHELLQAESRATLDSAIVHTAITTHTVLELLNLDCNSPYDTEKTWGQEIPHYLCIPHMSDQYLAFKKCSVNIYVASLRRIMCLSKDKAIMEFSLFWSVFPQLHSPWLVLSKLMFSWYLFPELPTCYVDLCTFAFV